MKTWINSNFGTWRGLGRAMLAFLGLATGRQHRFTLQRAGTLRLVFFVCHCNVCRNAYAHHDALQYGLRVPSLGMSTSSDGFSPAQALAGAGRAGVNLQFHRPTLLLDFEVCGGDQFFVMEVRKAHQLKRRLRFRSALQVCLLEMWYKPNMPYFHDPYTLSGSYFNRCFEHICGAVRNLNVALLNARPVSRKYAEREGSLA